MNHRPNDSDGPGMQPVGSEVVADPKGGGVTLVVPPLGLRRAPKGPFVFAVLWLGITALFTIDAADAAGGKMLPINAGGRVGVAVFLGVFWLAGLWLLAIAVRAAFTRTVLAIHGPFFSLRLEGPFRTSRRRWLRTDTRELIIEGSSLPANSGGPGIPHLRIRINHWRRGIGVLAARDRRELCWVADVMSRALEEAARRDPQGIPDVHEQPTASRAVLERGPNGLTLNFPAPGFRGAIPVVIVAGLLAGAALMAGAWAVATCTDWPWAPLTWLGVCIPIGLGLLALGTVVEAVGYALRPDAITVEGAILTASHATRWGGLRRREWGRSQIVAIDVDVGTSPLPRLRIHEAEGRKKNLLLYRDEDELLWAATLLREALTAPAVPQK
jgi:hypothetical protein